MTREAMLQEISQLPDDLLELFLNFVKMSQESLMAQSDTTKVKSNSTIEQKKQAFARLEQLRKENAQTQFAPFEEERELAMNELFYKQI